jgi:hypothetical protein
MATANTTYALSGWSQRNFQRIVDDGTVFAEAARAEILRIPPLASLHAAIRPPSSGERNIPMSAAHVLQWRALWNRMTNIQQHPFIQTRGALAAGPVPGTKPDDEPFWAVLVGA